jgi:ubiquinone/menaquinone biosynthesis C-methylase UbiE
VTAAGTGAPVSSPGRSPRNTSAEERYLEKLEGARNTWWNTGNFDKWKNLYAGEYPRGFFIIDTLRRYAAGFRAEAASVLDIGCGDAGVLIAFAEQGASCAGIESFEASVERGRMRATDHGVEVDLRLGVAESLPFPDASFDLVMLDNVLEHVDDRALTLREVRRVLKPGGLLYLVTPKPFTPYSIWRDPHYDLAGLVLMPRRMQVWYFEKIRGGGQGNFGVGIIPTRRGVRRLLQEAGFRVTVSPRELWIHYLRDRVSRPQEVGSGIKRRISRYISSRSWPFENRVMRWLWDVSIGSNFVIARVGE